MKRKMCENLGTGTVPGIFILALTFRLKAHTGTRKPSMRVYINFELEKAWIWI